jgi:hypothetical protein
LRTFWFFELSLSNVFLPSLTAGLARQEQKVPLEQVRDFLDEEFLGRDEGTIYVVGDLVVGEEHGDVECRSVDHCLGKPHELNLFTDGKTASKLLGSMNYSWV